MLVNKPPMGWNSWNTFGKDIDEQLLRETADAMVSTGLSKAGYEYIVIDDEWACRQRDENGRIRPNPELFPSGLRALSDYIHARGLKFGIYSCAGVRTCALYPGSFDNEFIDAETFADFGCDFLKYDFCCFPHHGNGMQRYNRMGMALRSTGRDILFSACNWGLDNAEQWMRSTGAHMYRSTGDIGERFSALARIAVSQFDKFQYASSQCFNDLDMLICGMDGVGNVGHPGLCNDTDYRTHFALWCMTQSPLMIGADLRRLRPEMISLLTHPDLLRISQDSACCPPVILGQDFRYCMFRHLSGCEFALAFFNLQDEAADITFRPQDIGFSQHLGFGFQLREVFSGKTIDYLDTELHAELQAHDCSVFIGHYVSDDMHPDHHKQGDC